MDDEMMNELTHELITTLKGMHKMENISKPSGHMRGAPMMMHYIMEHGGEASPGEISRMMGISTARITTVLGNLEKKGWLERSIDPRDRRKIVVRMTEAGLAEAQRQEQEMLQGLRSLVTYLGEEDTREAIRLLKKLRSWNADGLCTICEDTEGRRPEDGKDI